MFSYNIEFLNICVEIKTTELKIMPLWLSGRAADSCLKNRTVIVICRPWVQFPPEALNQHRGQLTHFFKYSNEIIQTLVFN